MDVIDRTVLITGATGKLGRSIALGFAGLGWNVAFTSRGGDEAAKLVDSCAQRGAGRTLCVKVDLTDESAPSRIRDELAKNDLLPDTLVNNARNLAFLEMGDDNRPSRSHWHGEFVLAVILPYELTMTLADVHDTPLRTVINISSMYGVTAPNTALYDRPERESSVNYNVAKAAQIHLSKELAVRLAPRAISVNTVSFGGVAGRATEAFKARYAKLCPAGRMLDDSEVFGPVSFLASPAASGMTGHNLIVDGGWTIW
jgi:NAD(P)-dependent dehydrogenase (short-subunit alcohol dehydrogenase family)